MTFKDVMEGYQKTVEAYLQTLFAEDAPQKQLFDAMRYSLLAGGKRIRPILVLEFCRICGGETEKALPFAAAIEMVHTYSLIHDDLPCMDNDDYRRGRLTNHKVFGEANAVLAGDALLTAAFGQLARAELPAERIGKAVALLSQRAGECGMVGGQVLDLAGEQLVLTEEEIYNVHRLKTGALISAACQLGGRHAGAARCGRPLRGGAGACVPDQRRHAGRSRRRRKNGKSDRHGRKQEHVRAALRRGRLLTAH